MDSTLDDIRTRVLESEEFRRAPTLARVLNYLVDAELADRAVQLTAYRVAVEAFGKPADFNPATSAAVRVEMSRLRRVLQEYARRHPSSPALEIPRGSYSVRVIGPEAGNATSLARLAVPPTGPGLLILAFRSRSTDIEGVADSLGRMIYDEIARYRWLQVVDALDLPSDSAGMFEMCTERYACQYMLRGQGMLGGGNSEIALELELMDATMRTSVWRDRFSMPIADIYSLGRACARNIASTLGAPLGVITTSHVYDVPRGENEQRSAAARLVVAFQRYRAMARNAAANEALHASLTDLLARWPMFALGWAMLGVVEADRVLFGLSVPAEQQAILASARAMLERATELEPALDQAHFMLARLHFIHRDMPSFRSSLERAIELNPGNPEWRYLGGCLLCVSGDVATGLPLIDSTDLLEHHAMLYRVAAGLAMWAAGRPQLSVAALLEVYEDMPAYDVLVMRALALATVGDSARAVECLARAEARTPGVMRNLREKLSSWFLDEALLQRGLDTLAPIAARITA